MSSERTTIASSFPTRRRLCKERRPASPRRSAARPSSPPQKSRDVDVRFYEVEHSSLHPQENFACVVKQVCVRAKVDDGDARDFVFMTKALPLNEAKEKFLREVMLD